jgi:CheY-like chemotaxis protein/rubrerythrin
MKKIIKWLREVEHLANEVYLQAAASHISNTSFSKFLEKMAEEEAWHYHVMGSAAHLLEEEPDLIPAITVDHETGDRIQQYFYSLQHGLNNNSLSESEIIEKILEAELSEWNDIFLYVVNSLKEKTQEFNYPAAQFQSHLKRIENHLDTLDNKSQFLDRISTLPPVWVEKILVVDDDPMIAHIIKSLLNREGDIDIATNGKEALEMMENKYYKLIISDINMPIMDGITFYQEASKVFPKLNTRMVFISGNMTSSRQEYFNSQNIQFLEKPMPIKELKKCAFSILLAN